MLSVTLYVSVWYVRSAQTKYTTQSSTTRASSRRYSFLGFSPPNTPEIVVEKSVKSVEMLPVVRTSFRTLANSMAVMLPTTKMKMQTGIR